MDFRKNWINKKSIRKWTKIQEFCQRVTGICIWVGNSSLRTYLMEQSDLLEMVWMIIVNGPGRWVSTLKLYIIDSLVLFLIVSSLNKEGWMIPIITVDHGPLYCHGLSLSSPCTRPDTKWTCSNISGGGGAGRESNFKRQNISDTAFTENCAKGREMGFVL